MSTPAPVRRSVIAPWQMLDGNEALYQRVVDNDRLLWWTGTCWTDVGMATDEHRALYPTVKDDL